MGFPIESDWLQSAIKYSLAETSYTSSSGELGPPEQTDPRFRKLVEGIFYSRRLILTYHLVILGLVAFATSLHWLERARTWRRERKLQLQYSEDAATSGLRKGVAESLSSERGSSSGSSTLEGAETPTFKDFDEGTPLLQQSHSLLALRPQSSLFKSIEAFMIYQPGPIPWLNKTLPCNGYTLIIVGLVTLNIFYTFLHINFTIFELFVFADRCGLVFAANLPLLYLLAAKTQPLRVLTGYSYESLNIIHRRLGELLCLEAFLHSIGMVAMWYTLLRPIGFNLERFFFNKIILLGIAAFISYEVLYLTSLASFRERWYELFLGLHVFLQATALVLLFFHHPNSRIYVGIALGVFIVDRLIYRVGIKSATFPAVAEIMEDTETVSLSAKVTLLRNSTFDRIFGRNITRGWQASDHVFVSVPSLGRKHAFQAHPFTIISRAPNAHDKDAKLELLIRAQRGFSSDLLREALERTSFTIRIDGPYGSHHARALLQDSDIALLVAGGSGIAVAWPLLHFLLDQNLPSDASTTSKPKYMSPPQRIILIWVVHRSSHVSWISWPALHKAEVKNGLKDVSVIVPNATEEVGRPDLPFLIKNVIAEGAGKRIAVVGSGPDSMGRAVRNACAQMVRDGWNVGVTIEKFGW